MPVHSRGWSGTAMAAAQCRVQARDVLRRTAMDTKAKRYLRRIKYGEMEHQSIRYGAVFVMDMYSMRRSCESRCFVRQALASRVPGRHHRFAASAGHLGDPTGGRLTNSRASRQPHWRKPCSPPLPWLACNASFCATSGSLGQKTPDLETREGHSHRQRGYEAINEDG